MTVAERARDLWWLWAVYAGLGWVLLGLLLWAGNGYMRSSKHLMNAYRLELGEPPPWPDHHCPMCNPEDS